MYCLDLKSITKETRDFNRDYPSLLSFSTAQQISFFKDQCIELNNIIYLVDKLHEDRQTNQLIINILLSVLIELLLKLCIVKSDWTKIKIYIDYTFGDAKDEVKNILTEYKLTNKQMIRISDILDYSQELRNTNLHRPFKQAHHHATMNQQLILILILNKIFKLNLDQNQIERLREKRLVKIGMDFEDVKLEEIH